MSVAQEIKQAFDALEALVSTYDPISLLSQLTLTYLFVREGEFQGEASDLVTWQRRIEFTAGYLLARPYPLSRLAMVDGDVLARLEEMVDRYFMAITQQMLAESAEAGVTSEQAKIVADAKLWSFYIRGDAYAHQLYAFAQDLYGPHDAWFREHYDFTIAEGVSLAQAISRLYDERANDSRAHARDEARRHADELISRQEITDVEKRGVQTRMACSLHFGRSDQVLAFAPEDLSGLSGLPKRTCQGFLGRMSLRSSATEMRRSRSPSQILLPRHGITTRFMSAPL